MLQTELNPQLKLQLSDVALQYIHDKGGNLVISVKPTDGCCAGAILSPYCEVGLPRVAPTEHHLVKIANINLYLSKEVYFLTGQLEITLDKLLWLTLLTVRLHK